MERAPNCFVMAPAHDDPKNPKLTKSVRHIIFVEEPYDFSSRMSTPSGFRVFHIVSEFERNLHRAKNE